MNRRRDLLTVLAAHPQILGDLLVGRPGCAQAPTPFAWTKTAEEILDSLHKYISRISGAGHQRPTVFVRFKIFCFIVYESHLQEHDLKRNLGSIRVASHKPA